MFTFFSFLYFISLITCNCFVLSYSYLLSWLFLIYLSSLSSGDVTPEVPKIEESMALEEKRDLVAQTEKELQRKYVFRKKTNDEVAEALEVVDH